jgi:hypothetical protein
MKKRLTCLFTHIPLFPAFGACCVLAGLLPSIQAEEYHFTTIAGQPGLEARDGTNGAATFAYPWCTAKDAAGNIYVADSYGTIRKVRRDGTNWIVSTIAGASGTGGWSDGTNTDARFRYPLGIAVDRSGNVFVSDASRHTIRKLSPSGTNWVVTTWAGRINMSGSSDGPTGAFNEPMGLALDAGTNLYVADEWNHTIREITSSGYVSTVAGLAGNSGTTDGYHSSARFSYPTSVAVDANTNLYVTDSGNHTIRKITRSQTVTTLAGTPGTSGSADGTNGAALFHSPGGIAVGADGSLYVADTGNHTIRKIAPVGANWVVTTVAGSAGLPGSADGTNTDARFNSPEGISFDGLGNLVIADTMNSVLRLLTPDGTNFITTTVAGAAATRRTDGPGSLATFWSPYNMAFDSAGNLYVADRNNQVIRQLTPHGTNWLVSTIAGLPGTSGSADGTNSDGRFNFPQGVAVDNAGNIYVADTGGNVVRKLARSGTNSVVSTLAGSPSRPGSANGTNSSARFYYPAAVAVDVAGRLYIADLSAIRLVTSDGTNWVVTTIAGSSVMGGSADGTNSSAQFNNPSGLALDPVGNIYVADTSNHTIRKVTPVGTNWVVTTIAGLGGITNYGSADGTNATARFYQPSAIAVSSSGALLVADHLNSTIRKVTPVGTNWVVTTVGGLTGSTGTTDGTADAARFFWPQGIALDAAGNVFVADTKNGTIRRGELGPSLQLLNAQNQMSLAWQTWATNYILETCTNLPSHYWLALTNGVDNLTWPNNGAPAGFFRLRKP